MEGDTLLPQFDGKLELHVDEKPASEKLKKSKRSETKKLVRRFTTKVSNVGHKFNEAVGFTLDTGDEQIYRLYIDVIIL